jgi:hypothetical protein
MQAAAPGSSYASNAFTIGSTYNNACCPIERRHKWQFAKSFKKTTPPSSSYAAYRKSGSITIFDD